MCRGNHSSQLKSEFNTFLSYLPLVFYMTTQVYDSFPCPNDIRKSCVQDVTDFEGWTFLMYNIKIELSSQMTFPYETCIGIYFILILHLTLNFSS